jgi:hypothetical protein
MAVVVEHLELAEKADLHASTVAPIVSGPSVTGSSRLGRAQLCEPVTRSWRRLLTRDGIGDEVDDLVVAPEDRKVLEREIDRTDHGAAVAQVTELVELALSSGHDVTIARHADVTLHLR